MSKGYRRTGKIVLGLVTGIFILLMLSAMAGWLALHQSLPMLDGTLKVSGLTGEVKVMRDRRGVPDIVAADSQSAYFALGFLHGQERFFQMDLLRRSAAGELAALVGKGGLKMDRQRRIFQLRERVRRELSVLPEAQRQRLASYTDGVNTGLHALKSRPFEYWLLRTSPESWRDEDSLLVIAAMYFDLQGTQPGREYARGWIARNNPSQADFLLPTGSRWDTPLSGNVPVSPEIPRTAPVWWGKPSGTGEVKTGEDMKGSNGWLIARDGKAFVANDMHLGLALPGIWYQAQIQYVQQNEKIKLAGITLPGVPFLLSGSNGNIAWGFTNSYVDTFDWVIVDKSVKIRSQQVALAVNHGLAETFTVRTSDWGPVVSTPLGDMAMRWAIELPGALNLNLMAIGEEKSVDAALETGKRAGIPVQNLLVADSHGNIGWTLAGALPDRFSPGQQNTFPLQATPQSQWRAESLNPDRHPLRVNPAEADIVTANNRLLFDTTGDELGDGGADMGVRSFAISQKLKSKISVNVQSMHELQLDNQALLLQSWRDWLLHSLGQRQEGETTDRTRMRTLLASWDGNASAGSAAYALVARWRDDLYSTLFGELDSQLASQWPQAIYRRANPRWDETLFSLMNAGKWVPEGNSSWEDFTRHSLDIAWQAMAAGHTTWGDVNRSDYEHPLAKSLPLVGRYLRSPAVPLSGDNNVIHVNRPSFGASERMVVSPGDEQQATLSLPSGQSGNPLSPWWLNNFSNWTQEDAQPMLPGEAKYQLIIEGN
ncbi:Penicillin acylase 2 precursor [Serratia marcescens]|uniref:penicillin acylase family protein n=1 Tax=Serratia marcescens TaxID=615 RepID=UPI00030297C3|nr:penicillin acylase family protein [Serratia marcescens]MCC7686469.1 penicillin acylase family protein [Serratia marcescens]CAI0739070.1 Penicillin acylase 2 precursor [Serratia marcescens]CAI0740124.1 Penicillin acylase 2 precursor [Serratia marcescens]